MKKRICLYPLAAMVIAGTSVNVPGQILKCTIDPANSSFGPCVMIGDVTGDSIPDFVAAAPNAGTQDKLQVFSGADSSIVYTLGRLDGVFGNQSPDGAALTALGDYGGEPTPDFAATGFLYNSTTNGVIYIIEGATGVLLHQIDSPADDDTYSFGETMFMADLTGSSAADFVVGSPYAGTNDGRIYIYDGATRALAHTIDAPSPEVSQRFGLSSILPDLTGDGVPEIGAAAPYRDAGLTTDAGEAYIYNGATRTLFRTISLASPQADDRLTGPFPVGDLNGDTKGDYACTFGITGATAGFTIFSGDDGSVIDTVMSPGVDFSTFGRSIVPIDDITGDSVDDFAVGSGEDFYSYESQVWVYNGATRALVNTIGSPTGSSSKFGLIIQQVGDFDGDGRQDIAIPTNEGYGSIYIFTTSGRPAFLNSSLNLGENLIGGTASEASTTVFNAGLEDVNITSTSIAGTDAADFDVTTDPSPVTLAGGVTSTIGVTSVATTEGYKYADLVVGAANGSSDTIPLYQEAYGYPTGEDYELAYIAADDRVMIVNAINGNRATLSGPGFGSGTEFVDPYSYGEYVTDVLIEDDNNLIVCAARNLFRVDRSTGNRTRLNSSPLNDGIDGGGGGFVSMEWESPGVILLLNGSTYGAARINRVNLSTMLITVASLGTFSTGTTVGTGPAFGSYGSDMVLANDGMLYVMDFAGQQLVRVDPTTGNRTRLNTAPLPYAISIAQASANEFILGGFSPVTALLRYNVTNDTLTTVAAFTYPDPYLVSAMQILSNGTVVLYDGSQRLFGSVIPAIGDYTSIATPSVGLGPTLPASDYYSGAGLRMVSTQLPVSGAESWNLYR